MLKKLIEKIENSEALSASEFEKMKVYIKNISRYFNIAIYNIKIVEEYISNSLISYYIGVNYESFEDIIENNNLEEVLDAGGIACYELEEVI